jgi:SNF2 family DNA or RNA helicase
MRYKPYAYQQHAENHLIRHLAAALFMDMGLGKTVSTLSAVNRLKFDYLEVSKVLIIAPKRVAQNTWTDERDKWSHLHHLRMSLVLGTENERKAALLRKADIFIINRENVVWLVSYLGGAWPFDMVVIDESSSFKSSKAARWKALKKVRPFITRLVLLTGTPAPNSLIDLWAQLYLLDEGQRLGKTITSFRDAFCKSSPDGFGYDMRPGCEELIYNKIADVCISMRATDYLELPERINRVVPIHLPAAVKAQYRAFEKEQILQLENKDVTAFNAGALCSKLGQFANGAMYDADRHVHDLHDEKLDALDEIIDNASGQPVMVFYWFQHDLDRLKARLKAYKPRELHTPADLQAWNRGEIPVLLVHPASAGHGLNLQAGGHIIVWFGLTWSLELYQQAVARLHRQGQTKNVIVHHLVAIGTIDEDIMRALEQKRMGQDALLDAVKVRQLEYLREVM